MNPRTRGRLLQLLNPSLQVVAVYYQQRFCLMTLGEFGTILLELDDEARARLRPKMYDSKHPFLIAGAERLETILRRSAAILMDWTAAAAVGGLASDYVMPLEFRIPPRRFIDGAGGQ
jgi:hypothetical protein